MTPAEQSLAYAIQEDDPALVKKALDKGANPNVIDTFVGMPVLIHAVLKSSDTDILEMLLNKGADVNIQTSKGHTALMSAIMWGKPDFAIFLIQKGANTEIKNKEGKKAVDYLSKLAPEPQERVRAEINKRIGIRAASEIVVQKKLPTGLSKEVGKFFGGKRRSTVKRPRQSRRRRSQANRRGRSHSS